MTCNKSACTSLVSWGICWTGWANVPQQMPSTESWNQAKLSFCWRITQWIRKLFPLACKCISTGNAMSLSRILLPHINLGWHVLKWLIFADSFQLLGDLAAFQTGCSCSWSVRKTLSLSFIYDLDLFASLDIRNDVFWACSTSALYFQDSRQTTCARHHGPCIVVDSRCSKVTCLICFVTDISVASFGKNCGQLCHTLTFASTWIFSQLSFQDRQACWFTPARLSQKNSWIFEPTILSFICCSPYVWLKLFFASFMQTLETKHGDDSKKTVSQAITRNLKSTHVNLIFSFVRCCLSSGGFVWRELAPEEKFFNTCQKKLFSNGKHGIENDCPQQFLVWGCLCTMVEKGRAWQRRQLSSCSDQWKGKNKTPSSAQIEIHVGMSSLWRYFQNRSLISWYFCRMDRIQKTRVYSVWWKARVEDSPLMHYGTHQSGNVLSQTCNSVSVTHVSTPAVGRQDLILLIQVEYLDKG